MLRVRSKSKTNHNFLELSIYFNISPAEKKKKKDMKSMIVSQPAYADTRNVEMSAL